MRIATKIALIATLLTIIPGIAAAQAVRNYECTYGDLTRRVVIMSEPGVSVPCEVHYYKDTEAPGEDQVLWSASSEAGYCQAKTEEFVARLQGWGWDCGAAAAAPAEPAMPAEPAEPAMPEDPAEPPEPPTDMTEDLAPADPGTNAD